MARDFHTGQGSRQSRVGLATHVGNYIRKEIRRIVLNVIFTTAAVRDEK